MEPSDSSVLVSALRGLLGKVNENHQDQLRLHVQPLPLFLAPAQASRRRWHFYHNTTKSTKSTNINRYTVYTIYIYTQLQQDLPGTKSTKNSASVFRGFISWSSSFLTARFVGEIRACNDSCIYYADDDAAAAVDDDDDDDTVGFFSSKVAVLLWEGATSKRTIRVNLGLQLKHAWLMHGLLETHHGKPKILNFSLNLLSLRLRHLLALGKPHGMCSAWPTMMIFPCLDFHHLLFFLAWHWLVVIFEFSRPKVQCFTILWMEIGHLWHSNLSFWHHLILKMPSVPSPSPPVSLHAWLDPAIYLWLHRWFMSDLERSTSKQSFWQPFRSL